MSMAELDAGVEERVCRELAVATLEELAHEARLRFAHSERTAFDLHMVDRREHTAGCLIEDTPTTSYRFEPDGRRLAQTWSVIDAVHANASAGNSMAQRELWYRLKPFGLFEKPQEVFDRIMDVCAVISLRCCMPCPREAIGVIAASRGSMIGTLSLWASDEEVVSMETRVHAIPGDPIKCSKMRFAESRARFIVVVEKDTVFTRLVDDGFIHALPCLLITARGFPDLATRALVQNAVESLRLPGVVLTDYNPHGMALMLSYKVGSERFTLERYCCPQLRWIGLHAEHLEASLTTRFCAFAACATFDSPFATAMCCPI